LNKDLLNDFNFGLDKLTTAHLVELASVSNRQILVDKKATKVVKDFRKIIEEKVQSGNTYYGINTGFGSLSSVRIPDDQLRQLQVNLVRSHACGVGKPLEISIVRAILLLRAHTFMLGHSGISWEVVQLVLDMVERDVIPVVPEQGSVGASGDLAPLAHLALGMIGEGEVFYKGELCDARVAFDKEELKPLTLGPKEGLSLINGTHFMSAIAAFAIEESGRLLRAADVICAMSLDAVRGTTRAFDERVHNIRKQSGQSKVAKNIREIFSDQDDIMESHVDCNRVQDPYSFRCTPQVHGTSRDAFGYAENIVNNELNSVTDNPLAFDDGDIISGGNFHGQPVAMAMDFLGIAIAELGSISEQRTMKLTNSQLSGLPPFITENSGLNSGYMIPHVVAASLVSENKILTHPACVDTIPTSADMEDHVSMGPIAARKARTIIENVSKVLAIELLAGCQGVDLLVPLKPGPFLLEVFSQVRSMSPYMESDRSLHKDIEKVSEWILEGGIDRIIENGSYNIN